MESTEEEERIKGALPKKYDIQEGNYVYLTYFHSKAS